MKTSELNSWKWINCVMLFVKVFQTVSGSPGCQMIGKQLRSSQKTQT